MGQESEGHRAGLTSLSAKAAAVLAAIYGAADVSGGQLVPTDTDFSSQFGGTSDFRLGSGANSANASPVSGQPNSWNATVQVPGASANTLSLNGRVSGSNVGYGVGYGGRGDLRLIRLTQQFELTGNLTAPISVSGSSGSGPGTVIARTANASSNDFVEFRVDPILTQRLGEDATLYLSHVAKQMSGSVFGTPVSSTSGTVSGFTYSVVDTSVELKINGVSQAVAAAPTPSAIPVRIGDIISVKMLAGMSLSASNNSVATPSSGTATFTSLNASIIELSGTPGTSASDPILAQSISPSGIQRYSSLRTPLDITGGSNVIAAYLSFPKAQTLYFAVADDADPSLSQLFLPYFVKTGDTDGFTFSALVGGSWQVLPDTQQSLGFVALPTGTRAVAIGDIESNVSDFTVGLRASAPSEGMDYLASASPIPEPSVLGLIAPAALGLLARRSRHRQATC